MVDHNNMKGAFDGGGAASGDSSSGAGLGHQTTDEFIIDKSEYMQVFKMFEQPGKPGEIHITSVFDLINKFEQAGK